MSDPNSTIEFFEYLQQQSVSAYKDIADPEGDVVPIIGIKPLEYYQNPPSQEQTVTTSTLTPNDPVISSMLGNPTYNNSTAISQPVAPSPRGESKQENYSYHSAPTGDVPPNFRVGDCCSSCKYFNNNSNECLKYDYPTAESYVCSTYKRRDPYIASYYDEETESYSFKFDLTKDPSAGLQALSDTWEPTTKEILHKKKIDFVKLSQGEYSIVDKNTARIALRLQDMLVDSKDKAALLEVISKFIPTSSPTEEPVILSEGGAAAAAGSATMSGSVSAPSSVGTEITLGNLPLRNTLYELAGKRVKARAAKTGQTVTELDIQKEFERVLKIRAKG